MNIAAHEATRYVCIKSTPALFSHEVEDPKRKVVFVTISWGDSVLFAGEVDPDRGFFLGDAAQRSEECWFSLPFEILGEHSAPLVHFQNGVPVLRIPQRASARVVHQGGRRASFGALNHELPGEARERLLEAGCRVEMELGQLRFNVEHAAAGRRTERKGLAPDSEVLGFQFLSFAVIGSLLAAMAYFLPPLGLAADEEVAANDLYLISQYLSASSERELETLEEQGNEALGSEAEPAAAEPIQADPDQQPSSAGTRKYTANPSPLLHQETIEAARQFGMVSLLQTLGSEATASAWTADVHELAGTPSGLWGDELGDIAGKGLRLSGDGLSSGGPGAGIDLQEITGFNGQLPGERGFIRGPGRPGGPGHIAKAPTLGTAGKTIVSGHLPPEVVQRTVRQNFGRFRLCYERGLMKNPNLTGRLEVRFLIDRSGAVAQAMQGQSDLPDAEVTSCIVQQFFALSFPQPENGTVRVSYPLMLTPGA